MSTKIKLILTLGVILLGTFCSWLEATFADSFVAIVIIGLTAFMIIALWLFPEAGAKDDT
ncbi:MAG: hypothetical protein VX879_03210 [Pseudomonadota bacterium]|nr:hypothetical protein [Pseudomonadota bacterium]